MKSFYNHLKWIILFASSFSQAQILNGDFEQWSGREPVYWYSSNDPLCSPGVVNIFQTSKAYSGNSAVYGKVVNVNVIGDCGGGTNDYPPSISTYDWDGDFIGFPLSGRPKQMRIHYIYKPVGEGGAFSASVYLTKWDGAQGGRVIVGTGGFFIFNTAFLDSEYTEHVSAMSYYYDEDPDTIVISFSLFSNDVGSEFYLDDISLSFMQIISPSNDDVIIAGEKDTIRWDAGTGKINIMYSLDDGNSYTIIESNYPADSSKYIWDVPDDLLSAKAKIKIEDSDDNTQYDEKSVYIKPWQLTRIDANGDFELFEPSKNGWSFCNCEDNVWPLSWWEQFNYYDGIDPNTGKEYPSREPFSSAITSDFPDWPIFVDALGYSNCYIGNAYNSRATTLWDANTNNWGGSCEGFAVSSLLYFYHENYMSFKFPNVGDLQAVNSDSVNDDIRKVINRYFIHQFTDPFSSYENQRWNTVDARQTLQELKAMFGQNNKDAMPLGFYNNNGSGGHAVTPFKLERIGDTPVFNLRVYDSNNPGVRNKGIRIDSAANTWTEVTGLYWGSGTTGCLLGLKSSEHLFNVHLPSRTVLNGAPDKESNILRTQSSKLDLYNNSSAEIIIKNSEGEIGYKDSVITNTITNAIPKIPKTGKNHPPIGYSLPLDDYSIQVNNFTDSSSYIFILDTNTIYNFRRYDAVLNQTDIFSFSNGLGFENVDQSMKKINLETVIEEDSSEKVFVAGKLQISKDDSIHVNELDRNKLVLKNFGLAKSYNLQVRSANPIEAQEFNHTNISIANNSSHLIVPTWGKIEIEPVKILIDNDNDGSIDDSMFVSNETTGINSVFTTKNPTEFSLYQNYPNPFNPTTTIRYDLPTRSFVTLKIYNILGEEVAILVNGVKQTGSYNVVFDASELPSGVYIYKLTTNDYVSSRKMIVIK